MSNLRIGSLFSGYLGLDMAVEAFTGATTAWVSDIDKGACAVLAHRAPDVPNIGDITKVDWSQVEPVDILTGGTPCQDLSHAGKRGGMSVGTRSNLWVSMREAIAQLNPSLVVWENVRGAYSAKADSALEHCPGCMGDGRPVPPLRALGRVLGDLSTLGYDARWHGVRASEAGAPHQRLRVFLIAFPHDQGPRIGRGEPDGRPEPVGGIPDTNLLPNPGVAGGNKNIPDDATWSGKAAYRADGTKVQVNLDQIAKLLPTPAVNDMGAGKSVEEWDEWTAKMKEKHGNGNGHGASLSIEAQRLMPTPRARDSQAEGLEAGVDRMDRYGTSSMPTVAKLLPTPVTSYSQRDPEEWRDGRPAGNGGRREAIGDLEIVTKLLPTPVSSDYKGSTAERREEGNDRSQLDALTEGRAARGVVDWGIYADAVTRWEGVVGPAPTPTMLSTKGTPQLAPPFTEWMMGLPSGWVTDVPGLSRAQKLKVLGNGVVPQQALLALTLLLGNEGTG